MSEAQLLQTISSAASLQGWGWYHTHDSRHSPPGYPDLTICGYGKLIYWELKSAKGTVSPDQQRWLDALGTVVKPPIVETIRPADLDRCLALLAQKPRASE
jgi:hypothetical protein